jgi:glucose-1-phosphate thymidylyltransferase
MRSAPAPATTTWEADTVALWGIVPAAGAGSRIQPLAFSKELLPVGSRIDRDVERPRAVSEFIVERLVAGGADRLCFVISPGKSDILEYYGGDVLGRPICYVVQSAPDGLCDAIFKASPFVMPDDRVMIGLPDTVWFPVDALKALPGDRLGLLLFPVTRPELFDAVVTRSDGVVVEVQVKNPKPTSGWVWGAIGMPGRVLHELRDLWEQRSREDAYLGSLINAYLARGGSAIGVPAGEAYVDVGTLHGYREAILLLAQDDTARPAPASAAAAAVARHR